jgi:hypothetical protein
MSGSFGRFVLVVTALAALSATNDSSAATITGVTVADFSSQRGAPFTRFANNTVNGSGLTGLQHSNVPDGTMWLSTGNGAAGGGADPLQPGARITFDLGARYHVGSMRVWNYNEVPGFNSRSARQVELLAASTVGGPFNSLGVITLAQAPGNGTYTGQVIDFSTLNINLIDVRQLRFNILNSYGGDNGFVGLSEVRFDAVPEPQSQVIWLLGLVTLFGVVAWSGRRRFAASPQARV